MGKKDKMEDKVERYERRQSESGMTAGRECTRLVWKHIVHQTQPYWMWRKMLKELRTKWKEWGYRVTYKCVVMLMASIKKVLGRKVDTRKCCKEWKYIMYSGKDTSVKRMTRSLQQANGIKMELKWFGMKLKWW